MYLIRLRPWFATMQSCYSMYKFRDRQRAVYFLLSKGYDIEDSKTGVFSRAEKNGSISYASIEEK